MIFTKNLKTVIPRHIFQFPSNVIYIFPLHIGAILRHWIRGYISSNFERYELQINIEFLDTVGVRQYLSKSSSMIRNFKVVVGKSIPYF